MNQLRIHTKYIGYSLKSLLLDTRIVLFQTNIEQSLQEEADNYGLVAIYADETKTSVEELVQMIEKVEITEATYEYKY